MTIDTFKRISLFFLMSFLVSALFLPGQMTAAAVKTPGQFFGFKPGADRMLFNYESLVNYLKYLDNTSPRLKMIEIGKSPLDKPMYLYFISSEENIKNLDKLKEINKKLALDPDIPGNVRTALLEEGKVFLLATLSMHSDEVGPAQASPLIAYDLLTTRDPRKLEWLENVVFMTVPTHNPDGMDMIVSHYNKYKGTKYEDSSMPGVYNKYIGHDNNRDYVTLTQSDTCAVSAIYSRDWFPQVMVDKHQMGTTGTRYFVPPSHDPIAENVDSGLWNWTAIFGSNMMKDMTLRGQSGIARNFLFDDYWPGSTETCQYKNVISFLTEAASANLATPVFIEPNEIQVDGKGLAEYKKSINMDKQTLGNRARLHRCEKGVSCS